VITQSSLQKACSIKNKTFNEAVILVKSDGVMFVVNGDFQYFLHEFPELDIVYQKDTKNHSIASK